MTHYTSYLTASGGTIIAANNFTHTNGKVQGAWEVQGNMSVAATALGGTATIGFTGAGNQIFTNSGGNEPDGNYTVNKTAGTVTLTSALNLNFAGQTLTITAGMLDLASYNLTVASTLTVGASGTLQLQGGQAVTVGTKTFNAGSTVIYNGAGGYGSLVMGNAYHHLTFSGSGSWTHTGALDVNGNLTITSGTLTSADQNVNVAGGWSNAGTYTSGANTVTFDGTNQQFSGNTSFNHFTKSVASADTLTFAAGSTTTITGTATLTCAACPAGQYLSLRSGTPGTRWNFNLGAAATKAISYVDVQDSDASGSDATKIPVLPTSSLDSGNNLAWFSVTISGTVYTDEGTANIGAGKTVRLVKNGASLGAAVTNASGQFTISASVSSGEAILLYIDGNDGATTDATMVSVSPGGVLNNIDLYVDHLITRHDNAGPLTNALMSTAKGGYSDTEILYSEGGGNLTVSGAATELYVPAGHTFAPGGNVTAVHVDIRGTVSGGANTITASGNWDASSGNFTAGTSTVLFSGGGDTTFTPGASGYYNLTAQKAVAWADLIISGTATVSNDLYLNNPNNSVVAGGTIEVAGNVSVGASNIGGSALVRFVGAGNQSISSAGGWLPNVEVNKSGGALSLSGTIPAAGNWTQAAGTVNAGTSTLLFGGGSDTTFTPGTVSYYNLTVQKGDAWWDLIISGTATVSNDLYLNNPNSSVVTGGTIEVAGNVSVGVNHSGGSTLVRFVGTGNQNVSSSGGWLPNVEVSKSGGTLSLSGTLPVAANWTQTAGTVNAGTSTLLFGGGSDTTFTPGTVSYYNLTVQKGSAWWDLIISGTATVSNDLYLNNPNSSVVTGGAINVGRHLTIGATHSGGSSAVTLNGSGAQTITVNGAGIFPSGIFTINKPAGTASLASNLTLSTAGQDLTITSGTLDLAGYNLTLTGAGDVLTVGASGTLQLQGGETITATTKTLNAGSTVIYNGAGGYGSLVMGNSYHHLIFNGSGSWTHTGALDTNGNLTITAGTVNSNGQNVSVAGNWTNSGTYTSGANTVALDGTAQSVSGDTTFNNFTKSVATAETLTFATGSTTTINGAATLNGAAGQLLRLRSSTPGTRWNFVLNSGATKAISYVDVQDSNASTSAIALKPVNPPNSVSSGNNLAWFLGIGGTVYIDEGVTNIGAGKTVRLLINGASVSTAATDVNGAYSIDTPSLAANDALLAYIDNDATYAGTAVSVASASGAANFDIYAAHLITRHDNGAALSNANMSAAKGAYVDADILYSVAGGNLTVNGATTELYVPTGHTFTPGGNVSTVHVKVLGTMNGGANTFDVSGSWDSSVGTWNAETSTVSLTGTGSIAQYTAATPWGYGFNNLSLAAAGQITTLASTSLWVKKLTIGSGTLTDGPNAYSVILQGTGDVFVDGGGVLAIDAFYYRVGNDTQNVVGRDYSTVNTLGFYGVGGSGYTNLYSMQGNLTAKIIKINSNNSGVPGYNAPSVLNTNNYGITATGLEVGRSGELNDYGRLNAGSSSITINGPVTIFASDASGANEINAGSSLWTVSGNWANYDIFTPGTSTVTLNGANQSISGNTTFNNLTKSVATARTLTFDAGATTSVSGTATLNGASGQLLTLASSLPGTRWNFVVQSGATKNISYVSVNDSNASGSAAAQLPINPANAVDGGNTISWFSNLAIVKQAWELGGTAPLASPAMAPVGSTVVFLIYVKNTASGAVTDVRVNDSLDETAFQYVPGSLVRTSAALPPADTASDLAIFNATVPGTGTALNDAVDGDAGSAQDTGGLGDVDRITVGAVTGQANGPLTINGHETFGFRFRAKVK